MKLVISGKGDGSDLETCRCSALDFPSENVLSLISPQKYGITSGVPHLHLGLFAVTVRSSTWRMGNTRLSTTERMFTLFNSPTSDKEPVAERLKISISLACHLPASAVTAFVSSAVPPSSRHLQSSHLPPTSARTQRRGWTANSSLP